MVVNLVKEKWIPVIRRSGIREMIAPSEMTTKIDDDPIIRIDAPRPDFNGALIQFLIGIIQTSMAPEDGVMLSEFREDPPDEIILKAALHPFEEAFHLGGDRRRFMQDSTVKDTDRWLIDSLLIEMPPSDISIKDNRDLFIKRSTVQAICPECAAQALYTIQTNSPAGGRGHMTSMRGGGPLTTIIAGDTLWETVALNLLPLGDLGVRTQPKGPDEKIFPWMGSIPTSENGVTVTPKDAHPYHAYFGMPKRIYLDDGDTKQGVCDLCGVTSQDLMTHYWARPYGIKYSDWTHPLSPYYLKTDKNGDMWLPVHPQEGGITYQHWLGLVQATLSDKKMIAKVVSSYYRHSGVDDPIHPVLWAFGYDMENKKAKSWYESQMPLIKIALICKEIYEEEIRSIILTAEMLTYNVANQTKSAIFENPKDVKEISIVKRQFWEMTEPLFYNVIRELQRAIEAGEQTESIRENWLQSTREATFAIFDNYVKIPLLGEFDPRRAVKARSLLLYLNSRRNPMVRQKLKLTPTDEEREREEAGKSKRRGKKGDSS